MTLISAERTVSNVFPVGMQNSALVLSDEDESSVVTKLDELSSVSENSISPAAINIENSSDVIIGPVTQFHGPVTIYQNVPRGGLRENRAANGKLIKSESSASDTPHANEKSSNKPLLLYSKYVKCIGLLLALIILIIIISLVVILTVKSDDSTTQPTTSSKDFGDEVVTAPSGPGAILDKETWGGRKAKNYTVPLAHPTPFVIISHTVTPFCTGFSQCSSRVQSIQQYHVGSLGSPDVGYNFLIGGDGNAYVGRGWDIKNFHSAQSIGICFIGNYHYDHLTPEMIKMTQTLLKEGVEKGKLAKDYRLIAHNQTFDTESPGVNVYAEIKTWPHFDNGTYFSMS